MKVIVDENLHGFLVESLKLNGFEVIKIAEKSSGIPDEQVIEVVKSFEGILVTEDKDFGELVFAHKIAKVTVVFLRYRKPELERIANTLNEIVKEYQLKEGEFFITITSTRIRIRQL